MRLINAINTNRASCVRSALSDPKLLEVARQQILSQPAVAEALGISADMIPDPVEWYTRHTTTISCCLGEYFFTRYVTIRAALVDKGLDSLTNTDSVIGEKVCIGISSFIATCR